MTVSRRSRVVQFAAQDANLLRSWQSETQCWLYLPSAVSEHKRPEPVHKEQISWERPLHKRRDMEISAYMSQKGHQCLLWCCWWQKVSMKIGSLQGFILTQIECKNLSYRLWSSARGPRVEAWRYPFWAFTTAQASLLTGSNRISKQNKGNLNCIPACANWKPSIGHHQ